VGISGGGTDRRLLERLALDAWSVPAAVPVDSVTVTGNRAEVALVVNGDYEYWTYFQRHAQGWRETVQENAPIDGCDDPLVIRWGEP
jgi:hypothetical protein